MADQSAGRVSLHPCFRQGLWMASVEITGEGGTPALFCLHGKTGQRDEQDNNRKFRSWRSGGF